MLSSTPAVGLLSCCAARSVLTSEFSLFLAILIAVLAAATNFSLLLHPPLLLLPRDAPDGWVLASHLSPSACSPSQFNFLLVPLPPSSAGPYCPDPGLSGYGTR